MTAVLRLGVIGLGEVAQITHLPILQGMSDQFAISAICDVSPGLLSVIGERHGIGPERRFMDAAALAALPDVDVVLVLSSDEYHAEQTIAALRHGKHVFVEKPICLHEGDLEAIIRARDDAETHVVVGYMRRFAPALLAMKEELPSLGPITYGRVRDIIGSNRLMIEQTSDVARFDDLDPALMGDRQWRAEEQVEAALGSVSAERTRAYRLLCGLGSHDLSAMRELLGPPHAVIAADTWRGGRFVTALFDYGDYRVTFEMGVDQQRRFDAVIEVLGERASLTVRYDTPYIRHLPTRLIRHETIGARYTESILRPTFTDPYTLQWRHLADVFTGRVTPKTTPEDSVHDLRLFREIIAAMPAV